MNTHLLSPSYVTGSGSAGETQESPRWPARNLPSARVFKGEKMGHNSKRGLGGQTDLTLNPDPVNYYLCDLGKASKTSLNQGFLSFFFFFLIY